MMHVEGIESDSEDIVRAIDALPAVSLLSLLATSTTKKARFRVSLRCYGSHHNYSYVGLFASRR